MISDAAIVIILGPGKGLLAKHYNEWKSWALLPGMSDSHVNKKSSSLDQVKFEFLGRINWNQIARHIAAKYPGFGNPYLLPIELVYGILTSEANDQSRSDNSLNELIGGQDVQRPRNATRPAPNDRKR